MVVTRFAPSPTGDLHLGGAWTALASHALGGRRILRIEDIDEPRVVSGSQERIVSDLRWLGLHWDLGPEDPTTVQSARKPLYRDALDRLRAQGLVYPCDCSRAEIARIASAPHAGEDLVYPGTCRNLPHDRAFRRAPALRLAVPPGTVERFHDEGGGGGVVSQHVGRDVGDFVLQRGDGLFSYQLAVAVDDATMGVTHVVRGRDLLASTPRQLLLMRLLGLRAPSTYIHLPLVVDAAGERLAKRTRGARVRALRDAGISPEEVVGVLAFGLGLTADTTPMTPDALATRCADLAGPLPWARAPFRIPERWAALDANDEQEMP
ncbi:MAG: tRNA glutamyl-Q(34) synthetase GluQRS [Polyangiaceae bacterium]|nr:tRNA glutamyl-Q(34) synthetase GluQRS [Polyangiaceae bacterium]